MNIQTLKTVSLYGISHLLVDMTCIMLLYSAVIYGKLEGGNAFIIIVLYNILAFGLQSVIGDIFDKNKKPRVCAAIGCILTAAAALIYPHPVFAAIAAGIGNAAFHAGGGIVCLKAGKHKASIPGIYVAPGAMGLFLGALLVQKFNYTPEFCAAVLFIAAAAILLFKETESETVLKEENQIKYSRILIIANLLLAAIVLRSFIGMSISLPWKSSSVLLAALTAAVVLGKSLGGIAADKFGWMRVTVCALIISSPLIAFGINHPVLYIIGIFFFNFTMPVTLTAIANIMPRREGFAFGLTTLALIIGAMPSFINIKLGAENAAAVFFIIILSAVLIYSGLREYSKETV